MLATGTLAAALLVSGAVVGDASAEAADIAAPPPTAYLETSPNGIPSSAGVQNYWATDSCHYYDGDGNWHTDVCMRRLVDANGVLIPGVVSMFRNAGNGQVAEEQLRIDLSRPGRMSFGVPDGAGAIRLLATFVQVTNQQGQSSWVAELPNTSGTTVGGNTGGGLPDLSGMNPAARSQYLDLVTKINNSRHCDIVNTIGVATCVQVVG
jgi:hypothetical protein